MASENAAQSLPPGPAAVQNVPGASQDVAMLKQQADELAAALDGIREQIAAIQAQ
jgi:hypothetical protein